MERNIAWTKTKELMRKDIHYPYIAPEIILKEIGEIESYDLALCDWWFIGVVLYEWLVGFPPFAADTPTEMYHKIICCTSSLQFFKYQMSSAAEDFIKKYGIT
jgi:protein-serine/threonine kinase